MELLTRCLFIDWSEIDRAATEAAGKIKASGFRSDWVIGVARGGVVPARLFCDLLHLKNLAVVKVDHWGVTASPDGQAHLAYGTNVNLTNQKVLLVDDITDTGQSLLLAKQYLEEQRSAEVKTATLYHLNCSKFTPDFYGVEREWAWLIFPWNRREDMVNLVKKLAEKEERALEDTVKLKNLFQEAFTLEVEEDELQETILHMHELRLD